VAIAIQDLDALKRYLRDKAPIVRPPKDVVATGLESLDRLLEGGLPRGAITLITGLSGMGRMTIAARAMAVETRGEHAVAWVDGKGTAYPPALALEGVDLSRLLMVRGDERAVNAAHQIIDSGAFGVVVASGLDPFLSPSSIRRIQTASEGRSVCTILIVEPTAASSISNAELKLKVMRRSRGLWVEVDKHRSQTMGKKTFVELAS
jgi:hypothetical protein